MCDGVKILFFFASTVRNYIIKIIIVITILALFGPDGRGNKALNYPHTAYPFYGGGKFPRKRILSYTSNS